MGMKKSLALKGINYDVGTNYVPGYLSRVKLDHVTVQNELRVIKEILKCNCIQIFGSDVDRIALCAKEALDNDFFVWIQPRLVDATSEEMLEHLAKVAIVAEELRRKYQKITLNIGCELSIFMSGILPGKGYAQRANSLGFLWPFLFIFNNKLNQHLLKASRIARALFQGRISYGSGIWESIDWDLFDYIGLNYYRDAYNQSNYTDSLRSFHRYNKPIVITEFGCCSFKGAELKGANGDSIVDWSKMPPLIKKSYKRDERVQAEYLIDLLSIYESENIYGAFVFEFIEPRYPHLPERQRDLDMASYGIVKAYSSEAFENDGNYYWEPKLAFDYIAKRFGEE